MDQSMKVGVDVKDEPRAGRGEGLRTSVVRSCGMCGRTLGERLERHLVF